MAMQRMDRAQFFGKLPPLGEDELKKALWTLYWRGTAAMRGRVEAELDPQEACQQRHAEVKADDPQWTLKEVREFVDLARAGSCLGGDRRQGPGAEHQ